MAWKKEADSLFFCSYFFNLEPAAAAAGNYSSRYWGKLNGLLATIGLRSNWLELYMPQPVAQDAGSAASLVERFNARNNAEFHAFLDSFLSVEIVFLVLRRWLSLLFLSFRLREIERAFTPAGSAVSLWRIMKSDWIASTRGHVAVDGLFFFELFRKALQCVPRQRKGFYLFENQAWEKAMIHAWNESGHGELLAVPHSTRSFWDLRFTRDREEPLSSLPYDEPRPRQVVVNGRMSFEAFVADNYPREELVEGEALRYQHLNAARRARASQPSPEGKLRVLVLGDFTSDGTAALLRLLDETIPLLEFDASWTLKPHPSLPVDVGRFPWLSLDTSRRSLAEMLLDFDVAYASNATSAAVDAYIAGLQVVVILDDSELNFSPLRGNPEVGFAGTTRELAELFADARVKRSEIPPREDVFFLDPELPRWRHLLESTN